MLNTGIIHIMDKISTFSHILIIAYHAEWYHLYFSSKFTCCTDTGLLSRRAYAQTYIMMDKSSGIIMAMTSRRTQRHLEVEKLFQVLTVMDTRQDYKHERHHTTCTQMKVIFTYANRFRHAGGMSCVEFYEKLSRHNFGRRAEELLFNHD